MRQQERGFYMVLGGGTPNFRHNSLEAATKEARRLAEMYGGKFYVLKAVSATEQCKVITIPCSDEEYYEESGEVPF